MKRAISLGVILIGIATLTGVGLLIPNSVDNDPTATVLAAISNTCDRDGSRSYDLVSDIDITLTDGTSLTGTLRMEINGSDSYGMLSIEGVGSAESLYADGEYYYREGDAPWRRQIYIGNPPETTSDVCIPAAALGMLGSPRADTQTAQIDGEEYIDSGETELSGVTVRHYVPRPTPTPGATARQPSQTPVSGLEREFWIDAQGQIVQMRHETNEPGGRVVYMISLSGFGEANVIAAPVLPTPSPAPAP